jgi:hypothetical protein
MTPTESHLRQALRESMRMNGDVCKKPAPDEVPISARKSDMSEIDPQEFGRLQAQVEALLRSDSEKTNLLRELAENVTAMRLQMSEAKGGWKVLMLLGGGAAGLGSIVTLALARLKGLM